MHYSIIPAKVDRSEKGPLLDSARLLGAPVSGVSSAKMMHDFGVSRLHTIIMDLPLSLDPLNLARNKPVVSYDPTGVSRFGIFPRFEPSNVQWFETKACCIFHTANSWDSTITNHITGREETTAVNMLACRLTSASLVFSAGDLAAPIPSTKTPIADQEDEQCRLYYYQFSLDKSSVNREIPKRYCNVINHQWALSAIPFEFPTMLSSISMSTPKYIYGCSVSDSTFGAALGRAVKIDSLVKIDADTLIQRGIQNPPQQVKGCVDSRTVADVLGSQDPNDPIQVFKMPSGWYAQEARFVPRDFGNGEDDGWLLSYVFDESQLDADGECKLDAKSELWVIDAKSMRTVVAKIKLPQRVPYGLHGNWFSEKEIQKQRPVQKCRTLSSTNNISNQGSPFWRIWMWSRRLLEQNLA